MPLNYDANSMPLVQLAQWYHSEVLKFTSTGILSLNNAAVAHLVYHPDSKVWTIAWVDSVKVIWTAQIEKVSWGAHSCIIPNYCYIEAKVDKGRLVLVIHQI